MGAEREQGVDVGMEERERPDLGQRREIKTRGARRKQPQPLPAPTVVVSGAR